MLYSPSLQENKSKGKVNFTMTDFCLPKKQNSFLIAARSNMNRIQNKKVNILQFNDSFLPSDNKLKKKLHSVNQILLNDTLLAKPDFRNRPVLNMNSRNLSFSSKDFLNTSSVNPTKQHNFRRSGSFNYSNNKQEQCKAFSNQYSLNNRKTNDFDSLMTNLTSSPYKREISNYGKLSLLKKLVMI